MVLIYNLLVFFLGLYQRVAYNFLPLFSSWTKEFIVRIFHNHSITVDGKNPWDIQVKNEKFYMRTAVESTLGFGEAYMDGWFDCHDLTEMNFRLFRDKAYVDANPFTRFLNKIMLNGLNLQTRSLSKKVAEKHYNLSNELYEKMLDPTMNYTCGYWKNADNLNDSQIAKMELIAQKLFLKPGMSVLDMGCGFGSLAKYLGEKYHVKVVGVNISEEQVKWARKSCAHLPNVEFRLCDYRDVDEKFDRIVSIGLMEHVGPKNYRDFFKLAHNCLTDEGIFLFHTIGVAHHDMIVTDPWVHKYIFPNGVLPYYKDIPKYIEGLFVIEDWHNFGYDYYKTLLAWHKNFDSAWSILEKNCKLDNRFRRMWNYYLLMAAGLFKARKFHLWQVVLTKNGMNGGYHAAR